MLSSAQRQAYGNHLNQYALLRQDKGSVIRLIESSLSDALPNRRLARPWDPRLCVMETGVADVDAVYNSPDTNGAALFIIYSEANSTYFGNMIIADGHEVSLLSGQNIQCDISGFTLPSTVTNSIGFALIGDDQTFIPNIALINGVSLPFMDGGDAFTIAEGPIGLNPGQTTSIHEIRRGGDDCFSLSMTGIYFQDSDASVCAMKNTIPTTSEWSLIWLSILLIIGLTKIKESNQVIIKSAKSI